jgi:hypothetical protein
MRLPGARRLDDFSDQVRGEEQRMKISRRVHPGRDMHFSGLHQHQAVRFDGGLPPAVAPAAVARGHQRDAVGFMKEAPAALGVLHVQPVGGRKREISRDDRFLHSVLNCSAFTAA